MVNVLAHQDGYVRHGKLGDRAQHRRRSAGWHVAHQSRLRKPVFLSGYLCDQPSKVYGIAAAGRPILSIGALDGEIAALLTEFQCGIAVSQGDVAGLVRAIMRLQKDEVLRANFGQNARDLFEARYDKKIALRVWADTIAAVSKC